MPAFRAALVARGYGDTDTADIPEREWNKALDAATTETTYDITWTDSETGNENEASGSLRELHDAVVATGYTGSSIAVRDEAGFVRGWVGGANGWHAS